jgi:hypothetical protein
MTDNIRIFDPSVFKLSKDIKYKTHTVGEHQFTIIENFYEDLNKVLVEIEKLPYVYIGGLYKQYQNIFYKDFRQSYASNMPGTLLDYQTDKEFSKNLSKILQCEEKNLQIGPELLVNSWQKLNGISIFDDCYYSVHIDKIEYKNDPLFNEQHALVIYLNKEYSEDDGTNFYIPKINNYHDNCFTKKEHIDLLHFQRAIPNTAVLYNSKIIHGQSISRSPQFLTDFRRTQVIWITIFNDIEDLENK